MPRKLILIVAGPHKGITYDGPTMDCAFPLMVPQERLIGHYDPSKPYGNDTVELQLYHVHVICSIDREGLKHYYNVAMPYDDKRDPTHIAIDYLFEKALEA